MICNPIRNGKGLRDFGKGRNANRLVYHRYADLKLRNGLGKEPIPYTKEWYEKYSRKNLIS